MRKCPQCKSAPYNESATSCWMCGAALPPVRSEPMLADVLRERDELRTQLDAWHSVFGTSQLSHAQARLEAAEDAVRRLSANARNHDSSEAR
jgi:hypothetical protein